MLKKSPIFYGWIIVASSVAMNCYLSIAFFQGFQVFFLPILNEFGWSRAALSGAFSLRQLENGILAPIVGFLVQHWGPRKVIFLGVVIAGTGLILISFINSLTAFYIAFTIASIGVSGPSHGVSWPVIVSNWFIRLRGRALGIAMMGPVIGGPFVFIAALLNNWLGWRGAIASLGVGLLVIGIPLSFTARSKPEDYGYYPDGDKKDLVKDNENNHNKSLNYNGFSTLEALKNKYFWIIATIYAAQFAAISGLQVHFIPLLVGLEYSTTEAAAIFGFMFFLSGIGRLLAGSLADLIDHRIILGSLLFFQVVSLLILMQVTKSEHLLLALFSLIFGIGFGGTIPLRPFILAKLFGQQSQAAILGLLQGFSIGASVIGPIFYGWIFDVNQSYVTAMIGSMIVLLFAIPLVVLIPKDIIVK